jgi:hypothetical protein
MQVAQREGCDYVSHGATKRHRPNSLRTGLLRDPALHQDHRSMERESRFFSRYKGRNDLLSMDAHLAHCHGLVKARLAICHGCSNLIKLGLCKHRSARPKSTSPDRAAKNQAIAVVVHLEEIT